MRFDFVRLKFITRSFQTFDHARPLFIYFILFGKSPLKDNSLYLMKYECQIN